MANEKSNNINNISEPPLHYLVFDPSKETFDTIFNKLKIETSKNSNFLSIQNVVLFESKSSIDRHFNSIQKDIKNNKNDQNFFIIKLSKSLDIDSSNNKKMPILFTTPKLLRKEMERNSSSFKNLENIVLFGFKNILLDKFSKSLKKLGEKITLKTNFYFVSVNNRTNIKNIETENNNLNEGKLLKPLFEKYLKKPKKDKIKNLKNTNKTKYLYQKTCGNQEKFLILYTLFKFQIIHGKTIILVPLLSDAYRLKLFLRMFSISSMVYNKNHPKVFNYHILHHFSSTPSEILITPIEDVLLLFKGKEQKSKIRTKILINFDIKLEKSLNFENIFSTIFERKTKSFYVSLSAESAKEHEENSKTFNMSECSALNLSLKEVEGFKYRVNSVVTQIAKKDIKLEAIKEITREEKLKENEEIKAYVNKKGRKYSKLLKQKESSRFVDNLPFYLLKNKSLKKMAQKEEYLEKNAVKRIKRLRGNDVKRWKFKKRPWWKKSR